MARIKLGPNVLDMWGSIGEVTYSSWKGISYCKQKPKTVTNPNTAQQQKIRGLLGACAKKWREATPAEKDSWDSYQNMINDGDTPQGSHQLRPIKRNHMTGYNKLVSCNIVAKLADDSIAIPGVGQITIPPEGTSTPPQPGIESTAYDPVTHEITVTPTDIEAELIAAGFDEDTEGLGVLMRLWKRVKPHHPYVSQERFLGTDSASVKHATFASGAVAFTQTAYRTRGGGELDFAPGLHVELQLDIIAPSGLYSAMSNKAVEQTVAPSP